MKSTDLSAQPGSLTSQLAVFAHDTEYRSLPEPVQTHARALVVDALGCGLVGSTTPEVRALRAAVQAMSGGNGDSLMWGTSSLAGIPLAVLANGLAVHTREIDDFSLAYHAGSVVVPAAVAVAASVGASGAELLAAVTAGYEVSFRIAQGGAAAGMPGFLPFKQRGWHSTALFGPFGAAVAASKLLGLDAEGIKWAIGIAGSCASGTWAFNEEGNTSKRVHPGIAAKSGVIAAYLAQAGITGPSRILEADWGGFYNTHLWGEPWYPEHVTEALGHDWQILNAGFKPYASCRRVHSPIDALLLVMKNHGLTADQVSRITVNGNAIHERQLSRFPVTSVLEAQFSLPYTLASALLTGSAGLDQYTEAALRRPEITPVAERVKVVRDPAISETEEPRLEFELNDGRKLVETVHVPKGHPKNPLTPQELAEKFHVNAALVLPESEVATLERAAWSLETMPDVNHLVKLLSTNSGSVSGGTQSAIQADSDQ